MTVNKKGIHVLRRHIVSSAALRLLILSVVLALLAGFVLYRISNSSDTKKVEVVRYGGAGPAEGSYEVIATTKNGQSSRVSVVIGNLSNEELIALNDRLYEENKGLSRSVYIDYFDDKDAAKDYFAKINDPSSSGDQKKELVEHYKAVMVSTDQLQKKLFTIGRETQLLKSY